MDTYWLKQLEERLEDFRQMHDVDDIASLVSIKLRVTNGCYERQCWPYAWKIIDEHLKLLSKPDACFRLVEHESGPEIITLFTLFISQLASPGDWVELTKYVVDLIVAMVNARARTPHNEVKNHGDLELIVRSCDTENGYWEEKALHVNFGDSVDSKTILRSIEKVVNSRCEKKRNKNNH